MLRRWVINAAAAAAATTSTAEAEKQISGGMMRSVDEEIDGGAVERILLHLRVAGLPRRHARRRQRRRRRLGGLATRRRRRRRRRRPTGARCAVTERVGMAVSRVHQRRRYTPVVTVVVWERRAAARVLDRTVLRCDEPHLQSPSVT